MAYGGGYGGHGGHNGTDPAGGQGGQGGAEGQVGQAGASGASGVGGRGGAAGTGTVTSRYGVFGNDGGAGGNGSSYGGGGGGGGGGAAGYSGPGANLTGNYYGGNGGYGGSGGGPHDAGEGGGGGGGHGGTGAEVSAANVTVSGTIEGGRGGPGSYATPFQKSSGGAAGSAGDGGAGGYGVSAASGTALTNTSTGSIAGGYGGSGETGGSGGAGAAGGGEAVDNSGMIQGGEGGYGQYGGAGGNGVTAYGNTTNENGGTIIGGAGGGTLIRIQTAHGGQGGAGVASHDVKVANSGVIRGGQGGYGDDTSGAAGAGVLATGGSVSNYSSGKIYGGAGAVYGPAAAGGAGVSASGTEIVNFGAITGGGGAYSSVGGAGIYGSSLRILDAGTVAGGVSSTGVQADAITLTGGTSTLTLEGNAGAAGASGLTGDVDIQAGTLSFDQGAVAGFFPDVELDAPIIGAGAVSIDSGTGTITLTSATSTFSGGTTIDAGTLDLEAADSVNGTGAVTAGAAGTGTITFASTTSAAANATPTTVLALGTAAQPGAGSPAQPNPYGHTIQDFDSGLGEAIDLHGVSVTSVTYTPTGTGTSGTTNGTLSVLETNGQTEDFSLADTDAVAFQAVGDGSGGTYVEAAVICFASGTCIRAARGDALVEVVVEDLRVGDLVMTASGARRPVTWLGHRTINCRRHPSPREAMPVRVAAHAFGENRPARDLYLSPGHSVCVDFFGEALIPVGRLANGATIAQVDVDEVTYWHIELDAHDILLAENLPCESYIDCSTRGFFAESDVVSLAAPPDAQVFTTDDYCRPFHPEGPLADFARERLCLRANDLGWRLEVEDPLGGLWLEVDGQRVVPHCDGLVARITLPGTVRDIVLCSDSAVPADIHGARDARRLGLQLASLVADDGLHWRREIVCTDARLVEGFHDHEGTLRWTDGRARLPAELWDGARDMFVLRLAFAGPALPRWVAPPAGELLGDAADSAMAAV